MGSDLCSEPPTSKLLVHAHIEACDTEDEKVSVRVTAYSGVPVDRSWTWPGTDGDGGAGGRTLIG